MRISDWSSDVCSSDLCGTGRAAHEHGVGGREESTTAPDRSETPAPASRSAPDSLTEPPSRSHPFRPPFIASSIAAIALAVLHLQALRLAGQIFEADVVAIGDRKSTRLNSSH